MEQYPDSIAVTAAASSWQNASGIWIAGSASGYVFDCRTEVNQAGRQIPADDGTLTDYVFEVYMPPTTTVISRGSDFVLTTARSGIFRGKVKRFSNGQFNSRLWL